ncbi:sodium-dependent bicarbonate transport family permease [Haloferula sp. A504]|uniref:sodium-dependent bicarbonate transport family permease n=1 Tax=Haloferula sp. A504 TaxID=3373601 RepID=UPI0031C53803|nr:sodium-dependent bicarbonate transport family permease [Verrucomicrobiaceae bacterium E54]
MDLLLQNLISPVVLAFLLGMVARWVKSDLEIPAAIYQALSIYLLFAIGLKGGVALSQTPIANLLGPLGMTLLLGVVTPFSAFMLLSTFGRLDRIDAGATAAHYGSVSAVTFLAALEAVKIANLEADGFLPALVAVLEVPGIIVGLLLARPRSSGGNAGGATLREAVHEVVAGKSIFLLIGGTVIGALSGPAKFESVAPFFAAPFKGALCLFLLELGMVAAKRLGDLREAGWRLIVCGIVLPLVHGLLGTLGGHFAGMTPGGAAVLGAMVGSASYIAAPAAVRIALPQASPGIYLTLALGVTFPFNLSIGIPLFLAFAKYLAKM